MQIHRYKYKVVKAVSPDDLAKEINNAAMKGWRLINVVAGDSRSYGYYAWLEQDRMSGR